ncbi:MAG: iron ABC transporter substrate-binding protein [Candidatus Helarchaeota archaeon]
MKKQYFIGIIIVIIASATIGALVVMNSSIFKMYGEKTVIDGLGRSVRVPNNPQKIVGINPGALRLLCYLNLTNKVVGVEMIEVTSPVKPYNFANPGLTNLPQIGPAFGGDPELIICAGPDVIFATYMEVGDADTLQRQTGIPVVVVAYGDLGTYRSSFYDSLRIIGEVMNVQNRAEELITYIDSIIDDLNNRTENIPNATRPTVYIGGIGYHGTHGLSSTEPCYPPFEFIHANNVASGLGVDHAFVDDEQVINWNPYYLFIDGGGLELAIQDIQNGSALWDTLDAIKENRTYVVLPYNYYTTNIETEIVDAYYIGMVLYPSNFTDINFTTKTSEIYNTFLGTDVYQDMVSEYGGCYQLDTSTL